MTKLALSLIVAAVLAVVATLVAPAVDAKEPSKGTSSITLTERPNEIPAFVAPPKGGQTERSPRFSRSASSRSRCIALKKLNADSTAALIRYAIKNRLVEG